MTTIMPQEKPKCNVFVDDKQYYSKIDYRFGGSTLYYITPVILTILTVCSGYFAFQGYPVTGILLTLLFIVSLTLSMYYNSEDMANKRNIDKLSSDCVVQVAK